MRRHQTCARIEKTTMVAQLPVAKEPGEHGEGAHSERLIDKWFLPFQRFLFGGAVFLAVS